jgi:hypothetical protein
MGCSRRIKSDSFEKIKQVYTKEVVETLNLLENRVKMNPEKAISFYRRAQAINICFREIDSAISLENNKIFITNNLNKIIEIYGNKKFTNDSILNIRFDIIKSAIEKNELNKFENNILLCELNSTIIRKINEDIDANDYKFNKIDAIVVSKKSKIKLGETYEANIYITASDTTRWPESTYKDEMISFEGGKGYLSIKGSSPGINKINGKIKLRIENKNKEVILPYEVIFEVK